MDQHDNGNRPAESSSAVRSRFWAGLNSTTAEAAPDEVEPGTGEPVDRAEESPSPRDQRP